MLASSDREGCVQGTPAGPERPGLEGRYEEHPVSCRRPVPLKASAYLAMGTVYKECCRRPVPLRWAEAFSAAPPVQWLLTTETPR